MSRNRSRRRRQRGFTLMEVLLVLAILVILGALAFFSFGGTLFESKRSTAKIQIDGFSMPINQYMLKEGSYPQSLNQLWDGTAPSGRTYLDKAVDQDPWGQPYQYEPPTDTGPNARYRISSGGPNGQPGDSDDVASDQKLN